MSFGQAGISTLSKPDGCHGITEPALSSILYKHVPKVNVLSTKPIDFVF